jgi:hypothetical protein
VAAVREHRQEPRATLCSPCAPGLEALQALAQAVVDALVVAGFEMQAGSVSSAPQ